MKSKFTLEEKYGVSNEEYRILEVINKLEFDINLLVANRLSKLTIYHNTYDKKEEAELEDLIAHLDKTISSKKKKLNEIIKEKEIICQYK
jgi:hypothetical protein